MGQIQYSTLPDRGLLKISGADKRDFLQGLISNDITRVTPEQAIYAALLTPQGKYLFDFFILELNGDLFLDCDAARVDDLTKRLTLYKLRADVALENISKDWCVAAIWGDDAREDMGLPVEPGIAKAWAGGVVYVDPRLAATGLRTILPAPMIADIAYEKVTAEDYDSHRLSLGLPDGSRDLIQEKSILMESGFDDLNGIDWQKGCYMGQELTARTKYRGLVKKRLIPVNIDGVLPAPGTAIIANGKEVGEIRSGAHHRALALVRLEHVNDATASLTAGDSTIIPDTPDWANF